MYVARFEKEPHFEEIERAAYSVEEIVYHIQQAGDYNCTRVVFKNIGFYR